jgi:hypothetical protein
VIVLVLIAGSFIMIGLGVIGLYVSRIYEEVKGRPRYVVRDETGRRVPERAGAARQRVPSPLDEARRGFSALARNREPFRSVTRAAASPG